MLYFKVEDVIRFTDTRIKYSEGNTEALVSVKWFWSQKGPTSGTFRFIYYNSRVFFFNALGTFKFLIPISGTTYKSSSSKTYIMPETSVEKRMCFTLVKRIGEITI